MVMHTRTTPQGIENGQVLFKGEIITKIEWCHIKIFRITGPEKLRFIMKAF
jgi:hypothetical protein